jgi:type I restriction enzyme S subunit
MVAERLEDIADVTAGTSPKGELINSDGVGLPFFQGSKEFGELVPRAERYTEHPVRTAREGDVLVGVRAPVGKVNLSPFDCAIGRGVMAVTPKNQSDGKFLFYFLRYLEGKWDALGSTGSIFENLSASVLRSVEIPENLNRPKIGEVLYDLDLKIENNKLLARTLESTAQTIFRSWFIDFDPVKAKMAGEAPVGMDAETAALFPDSMEECELGPLPSGWKTSSLGDLVELVGERAKAGGATLSAAYVPIDQISSRSIFLKNWLSGEEAKTSLVSFQKGDVLFGAMRPYFHKVCLAPFAGTTRSTVFVLRPRGSRLQMFSLMQMFAESTVEFATNNSSGSTIPYATWKGVLEDVRVVVPPHPLLDRFQELAESLVKAGYGFLKENETLSRLRDELLPRLISGELQIPDGMLAA